MWTTKPSIVILFLAIGGAVAQSTDQAESGSYTYTINAQRTEQTVPPGQPVIYMYYQITPQQNVTYFKEVSESHPFWLEAYIESDGGFEYFMAEDEGTSTCKEYEPVSWNYVAVTIITKNLMPDGECPVDPGSYLISNVVDGIEVTFPEMIPCGDYSLIMNLSRDHEWALQVGYQFNIRNDGNCVAN